MNEKQRSRLKFLRTSKKMSFATVSAKTGISKSHLFSLEKREDINPSLDLLEKLAVFYNVSTDYLIGNDSISDEDCIFFFRYRKCSEKCKRRMRAILDILRE